MNYLYTYVRWAWKTLIGRFSKVLFIYLSKMVSPLASFPQLHLFWISLEGNQSFTNNRSRILDSNMKTFYPLLFNWDITLK